MKKFILVLMFLLSVSVFAQEKDTTLVLDAQGDTVALVYNKGETPIIPANYGPLDSTAIYEKRVSDARAAVVMVVLGGIAGTALGIAGTVYFGSAFSSYGGALESGGVVGVFIVPLIIASAIGAIGGVVAIFDGGYTLSVGVEKYRADLENYKKRKQGLSVRFLPVVDPINESVGGYLALSF